MSCLDEEIIAAFVEARLPPDGIARLEAHVRDCAGCRELVSLALAAEPVSTTVPDAGPARPATAPRPAAAGDAEPPTLARGTAIGRYTVLALIGRGGMGEVYAAYDPELNRKVALKILNSDSDHKDARGGSRLLREAKAIAQLNHPNVVVVHDAGSFLDRVFIAMEYVRGQTLAAWLGEQPRTHRQILEVFLAAGRGLHAAHAAGLVHRDFKPQNVMVGSDGDVRVTDFGLARAIDAAAEANRVSGIDAIAPVDLALTETGELLGTPLYMAPEQFAGDRTDARTDQFSFCVALYQALYGAHPFGGKRVGDLMAAVTQGRLQPPPAKSAVAPWLRRILLRGLSPDPGDRYPSMTELLAALGRDPARRRRRSLALGASLLALAGIGVGSNRLADKRATCDGGAARSAAAWTPARREVIAKAFAATGSKRAAQALASTTAMLDRYVARWVGLFKETCEATHARGEQSTEVLDMRMSCLDEGLASVRALADTLAVADATVVDRAASAAAALPSLDRCNDVPALRAIVKPPEERAIRQKVAHLKEQLATVKALSSAGLCEQALRLGRPIQDAAKQIGYLPLQAEASYALGRRFDGCLDTKEALADLEDAVMLAEASRYDEIAITAASMLASAYADRLHDVRAGRHWLRLTEAILARFPGHAPLEAYVAVSRGIVLLHEGRLEDGMVETRRGLTLQEALLGPSSIEAGISANNLAIVLHELGRDDEALVNIRRVIEITRNTVGDGTGQLAIASQNESEILTALGQYDAAHAAIARALDIWRPLPGSEFMVGYCLVDQGQLELAEGKPALAVTTLEKALALVEGRDARFAAEARFALARALIAAAPSNQARAVALARSARAALANDPAAERLVRDIDRWQHQHSSPTVVAGARPNP